MQRCNWLVSSTHCRTWRPEEAYSIKTDWRWRSSTAALSHTLGSLKAKLLLVFYSAHGIASLKISRNVTNQGVACLSSMQSLRALHICGIPSLSNRGVIPVLKKLTNLQHLTLSSLPSIGRPCLRYLTSLTRLEYLDCTGMNIPAGAIHSLPAFARLDPSAVMLFDWRVMVRSPNFPVEW